MKTRNGDAIALKPKGWLRPAWGALLGGLAGFLLLHSYVMLLASAGAIPWHSSPAASVDWSLQSFLALERAMIPMAVPFAILGAVLGLMAGSYLNRAHRLQQLLLEQERSTTALETVRAFTDTLSHYLLNANMIIGGQVRHCRRSTPSYEVMDSLRIIEEQGMIIDAVIGALSDLARIVIFQESPGQVPMIDLARELENRLRRIGGESPTKEPTEP